MKPIYSYKQLTGFLAKPMAAPSAEVSVNRETISEAIDALRTRKGTMLTPEQKQDNKLRRMFEREFRNYNYDFTTAHWDGRKQYIDFIVENTFMAYAFGYRKGAKKC